MNRIIFDLQENFYTQSFSLKITYRRLLLIKLWRSLIITNLIISKKI